MRFSLSSAADACPDHVEVTHPGDLEPAEVRAGHRYVVHVVRDDERHFLVEQRLDLACYLALGVQVAGGGELVEQGVIVRVGPVRGVPRVLSETIRAEQWRT